MTALSDDGLRLSQCLTRSLISGFTPVLRSYAELEADILASPMTAASIGTDEGGLTIYKLTYGAAELPVLFLSCNMHGSEWGSAELAVEFANRWVNSSAAEFVWLRSHFQAVIIPSLNPTGYDDETYTNDNGVNLNRNFDYNWSAYPLQNPPSQEYKGTAAFSEAETQAARDLFQIHDPLLAVDVHTSTDSGGIDPGGVYAPALAPVERTMGVLSDMATITWSVRGNPTATAWYGDQVSEHGYKTISSLVEFIENEDGTAYAMTALYLMARQAYRYYEHRS